jgi:hypothetical protein
VTRKQFQLDGALCGATAIAWRFRVLPIVREGRARRLEERRGGGCELPIGESGRMDSRARPPRTTRRSTTWPPNALGSDIAANADRWETASKARNTGETRPPRLRLIEDASRADVRGSRGTPWYVERDPGSPAARRVNLGFVSAARVAPLVSRAVSNLAATPAGDVRLGYVPAISRSRLADAGGTSQERRIDSEKDGLEPGALGFADRRQWNLDVRAAGHV